ncbi:MaoC family dehydratase [uncultured Microscilla sp.]|uniref:MaoC family dehydratase n=1 Tax=uncultured Microscilla sp. TaxID=432653 RepID=UPI002608AF00|nr:MaoC family dehydratase [uncultured Microscilla sp.]
MIEQNEEYRHSFSFTQDDVIKFAEVTGDKNPLHLDADYAANTPFSQPIMHGFLAGSIFSKVFGTLFPGEGTIYMKQTMEFRRPMFVNKEYEAVFKVTDINREKHRAVISTSIVNKEDGKEAVNGEAMLMNKGSI